jgi:hypothetical protein
MKSMPFNNGIKFTQVAADVVVGKQMPSGMVI